MALLDEAEKTLVQKSSSMAPGGIMAEVRHRLRPQWRSISNSSQRTQFSMRLPTPRAKIQRLLDSYGTTWSHGPSCWSTTDTASPQTPDEVSLHIARELIRRGDLGDLASLSRSSRRFLRLIARSGLYQTVSLSSITAGDFDPYSRYVSDTLALLARDAPLAQCTIEVSLDEFPIRKRFVLAGETRTAIWFRDQGATLLKRREPLRVRVVDKHAMALRSFDCSRWTGSKGLRLKDVKVSFHSGRCTLFRRWRAVQYPPIFLPNMITRCLTEGSKSFCDRGNASRSDPCSGSRYSFDDKGPAKGIS
ncbi:hypothetical protein C8J56DRAFT_904799 [Mycena floridula]|nr:hypothetical protein C8J56DRAFT_904799 [Mycena floridula]